MKTIQLFNGRANKVQDAMLSKVGVEFHATFEDGHFVKFPFTDNIEELRAWVATHNEINKPVVTAAMLDEEQAKAEAFLATF